MVKTQDNISKVDVEFAVQTSDGLNLYLEATCSTGEDHMGLDTASIDEMHLSDKHGGYVLVDRHEYLGFEEQALQAVFDRLEEQKEQAS